VCVIIINKFVMQYVMYRTQANTRAVPLPHTGQTGPHQPARAWTGQTGPL